MSKVAAREKAALRKQEKKEAKAQAKHARLERRANVREEIAQEMVTSFEETYLTIDRGHHGGNVEHVIAYLERYEQQR